MIEEGVTYNVMPPDGVAPVAEIKEGRYYEPDKFLNHSATIEGNRLIERGTNKVIGTIDGLVLVREGDKTQFDLVPKR